MKQNVIPIDISVGQCILTKTRHLEYSPSFPLSLRHYTNLTAFHHQKSCYLVCVYICKAPVEVCINISSPVDLLQITDQQGPDSRVPPRIRCILSIVSGQYAIVTLTLAIVKKRFLVMHLNLGGLRCPQGPNPLNLKRILSIVYWLYYKKRRNNTSMRLRSDGLEESCFRLLCTQL